MTLPSFATQTVTVLRAGTVTDHGTNVPDWGAPSSHTIPGCSIQATTGSENPINRDSVTTLGVLFAPPGADVLDTDRVSYGGVTYEIDGPVRRWDTGVMDHVEANLKAVAG